MQCIDAHAHIATSHPEELKHVEQLGHKLLDICVTQEKDWRELRRRPYRRLSSEHPDVFAWCTTFDLPDLSRDFRPGHYAERIIEELKEDFAAGAVACKVWKNIGMELRDADGRYVMVDDPIFRPIFDFLEQSGKTLLTHLGEPLGCWRPLGPDNLHNAYYSEHPQWHMYGRKGFPSHEQIMAARDRLMERHRRMRIVGAHLGSLEFDLDAISERFERHPNFAIDTGGRLGDLAYHGTKTRDFLMRYDDRVLWGSDLSIDPWNYPHERVPPERWRWLADMYRLEWDYYTSDKPLTIEGRTTRGIHLPPAIQERFFRKNAQTWYPGL